MSPFSTTRAIHVYHARDTGSSSSARLRRGAARRRGREGGARALTAADHTRGAEAAAAAPELSKQGASAHR
jgi:hypothetical protein